MSEPTGITVPGRGEVEATPDVATMTFGVSVLRPTVGEAMADATRSADSLHRALGTAGVDDTDRRTSSFSVAPDYDYSGNRRRLVGFRVSNTVTATLRAVESIGAVIQAASDATGDDAHMSGLAFAIDDDAALVRAARDAAWADAEARADQLAGLAGVTRGSPTAITEIPRQGPTVPVLRAMAAEAAPSPPIEAGTLTVAVDITVTFAVE